MGAASRAKKAQSNSGGSNVDYDALNKYIVETADCEDTKVVAGYVSEIIDLGIQNQDPGMIELTNGKDSEGNTEEDLLDSYEGSRVVTRKNKTFLEYPRSPAGKAALMVTVPGIMLDTAKFFGKEEGEEVRPLRLILGGDFTRTAGRGNGSALKVVNNPASMKNTTKDFGDGKWSVASNSSLYKMARAAKLVQKGEAFPSDRIEELLGKVLAFEVSVSLYDGKYLNKTCKFASALMDGVPHPEVDESLIRSVWFDEDNDKQALTELDSAVLNTMMLALDYESDEYSIKSQVEEAKSFAKDLYNNKIIEFYKKDLKEDDSHNPQFGSSGSVSPSDSDSDDSADDGIPFDIDTSDDDSGSHTVDDGSPL